VGGVTTAAATTDTLNCVVAWAPRLSVTVRRTVKVPAAEGSSDVVVALVAVLKPLTMPPPSTSSQA
jgi:hypothetical protein